MDIDPIRGVEDQHRALARMLDKLATCGSGTVHAEAISEMMTDIGQFMREHFESEEAMLVRLGAPAEETQAHKDDHVRLIDRYVQLLVSEMNGRPPKASEVAALLQGWLGDHFKDHDCKLQQYAAQGKG